MAADVAVYQDFVDRARQERTEEEQRFGDNKYKNSFISEAGVYHFRIYPEIADNHISIFRRIWAYTLPGKLGWYRAPKEGDRIAKEFKRLEDAGLTKKNFRDMFKWAPREVGVMKAAVYGCPPAASRIVPQCAKWDGKTMVTPPTPMCLILPWQAMNAIRDYLAELEPANIKLVMEEEPYHWIELEWKSIKERWVANVRLDSFSPLVSKPALPDDFPTQDNAFIRPDELPDDDDIETIATEISKVIVGAKAGMNFTDPPATFGNGAASGAMAGASMLGGPPPATVAAQPSQSTQPPTTQVPAAVVTATSTTPPSNGAAAQSAAAPQPIVMAVAAAGQTPPCPGAGKGYTFGKHPVQKDMVCTLCLVEPQCSAATAATATA